MACVDEGGNPGVLTSLGRHNRCRRLDRNDLDPHPEEVLLFSCVRNENLRLPYFLHYYRNLGVDRFLFLDNDSIDGTTSFLLTQPDVHVFHSGDSYSGSQLGLEWIHSLLNEYGCGHWVIVADADELLVYPGSETLRLTSLVRQLELSGYNAMLTFLLDMYASGPIRKAHYIRGTSFFETCPYFDSDSYAYHVYGERTRVPAIGGVRHRLFWRSMKGMGEPPYLPKIPLVKWSNTLRYLVSTHRIENVLSAPSTGALLHFKLFSDFVKRATDEAERGEHWQGAQQYRAYAKGLAANPDLDPMYAGSVRFHGTAQLVEMGLLSN
jgi:hypothetical protein